MLKDIRYLVLNEQEVTRGGGGEWSLQNFNGISNKDFTTGESIHQEMIQKQNKHARSN